MKYSVEYSSKAVKQLKKMDPFDARHLVSWIDKNLDGTDEPRRLGKGLAGNRSDEWRYRVGNYRILCVIHDNRLVIEAFAVGHRREIYR